MKSPVEMTNAELRTEALEALAVSKDRTVSTPDRQRARSKWATYSREIEDREGDAYQKRQARLLRGF